MSVSGEMPEQLNPAEAFADVSFQAFRAPKGNRESLVEPSFAASRTLLDKNITTIRHYPSELSSLREPARQQLINDARRYTKAYRDDIPERLTDRPIVMAGHQPTIFHPGVWFKNFALDHIGRSTDAVAINLVVDSDVAGPSSVRVPHRRGDDGRLGFMNIPYDRRGGGVPYEQALIEDRELFDSFDRRVTESVSGIVDQPLVPLLWKHARDAINRCGFAGCALAQARHRLEADQGCQTLEIPQSVVCRGESFAKFVMHILRDLPRFHDCYNKSAEFYRHVHGIRSKAHPVPNLRRENDWYESPLWVYGNASAKRRGLWVRVLEGGQVAEISDRAGRLRRIDHFESDDAFESFMGIASPEFKIRSRALITTMYARLILSDLFLHGIGGGKYDQLGDLISRTFWGIDPPSFMVISATNLLPGHESFPLNRIDDSIRHVQRRLRDVEYQPERFANEASISADEIAAKQQLIENVPPRGQRRQWHPQIEAVNQQLSSALGDVSERLRAEQNRLTLDRRESLIWNNREHPFCVYPIEEITSAFRQMLADDR